MTKKSQKSTSLILCITATIAILLISNSINSYAQTNSTNTPNNPSLSNATSNATTTTNMQTTTQSGNSSVASIDAAVSAIKSGDVDGGKKSLYQAESALEGNPNAAGAEKHVEASLKALKEGDTNGAINHAELAKKGLA